MCCMWLTENTGGKKSPKNRHLRTIAQLCRARSSQSERNLWNSNISSRCPHNVANIGPLTPGIDWRAWGTPVYFNVYRVLAPLLQRCRSPEANQTLHDVWPSPGLVHPGLVHYIYIFRGLLLPDESLSAANFTLRPSLAFSYIGSITARHSTSGRQTNFAAWYKKWNYGTFAEAPPIFCWAAIMSGIGPHSCSLLNSALC